jgi:hypothetical protein
VPPRFLLSAKLLLLGGRPGDGGARLGSEASVWLYGAILGLRGGMYGSLEGNVFAHYFGRSPPRSDPRPGGHRHGDRLGRSGRSSSRSGTTPTGSYAAVTALAALPPSRSRLAAPFLRLRRGGRVR